jgi:hypothetical protein
METNQTKTTHAGFNVKKETERLWKILCKQHNKNKPRPLLKIVRRNRKGSSGTYCYSTRIVNVQMGTETIDAWETLAHELMHAIGFENHDRKFYHALKHLTEKRWNTTISSYEWNRYGYECDWSIQCQLREKDCVKF